jgi:hypothetical protein
LLNGGHKKKDRRTQRVGLPVLLTG